MAFDRPERARERGAHALASIPEDHRGTPRNTRWGDVWERGDGKARNPELLDVERPAGSLALEWLLDTASQVARRRRRRVGRCHIRVAVLVLVRPCARRLVAARVSRVIVPSFPTP
jgi:hypothetical protein